MSAMAWIVAASGLTTAGMAIMLAMYAWRNDRLRSEAVEAKAEAKASAKEREFTEEMLIEVNGVFTKYQERAERTEARLIEELERYGNKELEEIAKEPNTATRIKRTRSWVWDLLSESEEPTAPGRDQGS